MVDRISSWICYLCSHTGLYAYMDPVVGLMLAFAISKFFILNQGAPHFHFVLGLRNYVINHSHRVYRYRERRLSEKWRVDERDL